MIAQLAGKLFVVVFVGVFPLTMCSAADQPVAPTDSGIDNSSRVVQYWLGAKNKVQQAHDANTDPLRIRVWKTLDEADSPNSALNIATHPLNQQELNASLDWLFWKIFAQNADSRYSISYADLLANVSGNAQVQQQAMIFFINAQLATRIDAARCEDGTSGQAVVTLYQNRPSMAKLSDAYNHLSPAQRAEIKLHALAIEQLRGPRDAQDWVCSYGLAATRWAVAQHAATETPTPGSNGGTTINVNTYGYQPQLIGADKWAEKRLEIMKQSLVAIKTLAATPAH